MQKLRFAGAGAAIFALVAAASATPMINEIRIDQTSTDNDEYFELCGLAGEDLSAYTYLVIGDGTGGSGIIESITSLSGKVMAADGYFLTVETTWTGLFGGPPDYTVAVNILNFENGDNVTHMLVKGFTGSLNQDVDTNDDGVFDLTPWLSIEDSVAVVIDPTATTSEKFYSATVVGPEGTFAPGHVYRAPDCTGPWQIGTFAGGFDTAGFKNVPEPGSLAAMAAGFTALLALRRRK